MLLFNVASLFLFCALAEAATLEDLHPLSDEFIDLINSKQNSWKAGRNFAQDKFDYVKRLMGVPFDYHTDHYLEEKQHDPELIASLPDSFDPRDKWPNCPSLNEIRDQGSCGSCWAFGAVEAMTDRYCIYSNGTKNFHFSAQDLVSCLNSGSCGGGFPELAWKHWKDDGIVSGGAYNSKEGCKPYEIAPCEHFMSGPRPNCTYLPTPECKITCENGYNVDYKSDKRYAKNVYFLRGEDNIKAELFVNGPVEASFDVFSDFPAYKSGVYNHTSGKLLAGHAVKILGWGVENSMKYWLIANSWNSDWGDKGYFKILRGENVCGIEDDAVGGEPLIVN